MLPSYKAYSTYVHIFLLHRISNFLRQNIKKKSEWRNAAAKILLFSFTGVTGHFVTGVIAIAE